jgi:hypothetical protein
MGWKMISTARALFAAEDDDRIAAGHEGILQHAQPIWKIGCNLGGVIDADQQPGFSALTRSIGKWRGSYDWR